MIFEERLLEEAKIYLIDGDRGKNYPKHQDFRQRDGDCLFLSAKNVTENGFLFEECIFIDREKDLLLRSGKLSHNDIVLTTRGTIGNVALYDESVPYKSLRINSGMLIFRADPEIWSPRFLYFLMTSPYFKNQIQELTSGSAVPQLPAKDLKKFRLPIINLKIQKTIEKIIGDLEDKIKINRQINQTLEAMAQALFKSWFVDFEPVRAKMVVLSSGGNDDDANLAAMSAISGKSIHDLLAMQTDNPEQYQQLYATAELFPSEMVESELGEIPKGWEVKAFGSLLKATIGGDWGKDEPDEKHTEQVKILRGTDLPKVFLGDDSAVPVRFVEAKKLKTRLIEAGDIVIEVSGGSKDQPTGRSLYMNKTLISRLNAQLEPASFCRLFKPLSKKLGQFLGVYLEKIYQEGKTWHYQNQSTGISNFQTSTFLEKELLVVPPEPILSLFYTQVSPIFDKIYSSESNNLIQIRDSLLPKLLSGELSVDGVGDE